MALILIGVGVVLYTFGVALEALVEGHLRDVMRKAKMERHISSMSTNVIVSGWGRVGKATAGFLANAGQSVQRTARPHRRRHRRSTRRARDRPGSERLVRELSAASSDTPATQSRQRS